MTQHAHQLLAFVQVMRDGSFSAAARKMGVTQSALSQHIAKLEDSVGARLMVRGQGGLFLTPPGSELFELAEQFASLTSEIDERIQGYSNFDTGHLNIIANAPQPALASIAQFSQIFPNVEVNFTLFDWTRTMSMLSEHMVDLAFVTRPRKTKDCVYKKLYETEYVLYTRKSHPWADRQIVSLRDLEQEGLILPEKGSLTQKVVLEALAKHGVAPRRRLTTTTFPVMKEAILHGVGVGIFLANAAAHNEDLVQIKIPELTEKFEIYAASPKHKFRLRLVKAFWDELQDFPEKS